MGMATRRRTIGLALTGVLVASLTAFAAPAASIAAPTATATTITQTTPLVLFTAAKKKLKSATPKITGTKKVTKKLTAKPGAWTSGTRFTYKWYANGKVIKKATGKTFTLRVAQAGKKISVKVTGKKVGYTTVSRTSAKTAKVGYPASAAPTSTWNCPAWAPIKGNENSGIYHKPGGQYYSKTQPEVCFRTAAAAERAGFRAPKR